MKKAIFALLAALGWLATLAASHEGLRSRNISVQEGLRSNAVRNIVQDSVGFVWMGTDNGLSRYDGYEVRNYRIEALGSDQYVSALMVDGRRLLLGTSRGLFVFDTRSERFSPFLSKHISAQPTSMARDRDGNLWISTMGQGVWRYGERSKRLRRYAFGAQGGRISQVFVDADNQVWTLTMAGAPSICLLNKARDKFVPMSFEGVQGGYGGLRMAQGSDGTLWVGTWNNGLMRIGRDRRMSQAICPERCAMVRHIHTLVERSPNNLLLGCDDGVISYNPTTGEWQKLALEEAGNYSLSDKFVYSICCDKEGGVWFGTYYSGVSYLSASANRFAGYGHGVGGYGGNVVSRFCEDDDGHVWIGSDDAGLACYSTRMHRMVDYPGQAVLATYNVHGLCADGPRLWVGTYSNGIVRLDMATGAMRRYGEAEGLDGYSCYTLAKDGQGRLWAGTMQGICLYDAGADRFVQVRQPGAMVIDIDDDGRGNVWFATLGGGLLRYTPATRRWKEYRPDGRKGSLPSDQVNCVLTDGSGRVWVGTLAGLCRYDAGSDRFVPVPLGLPGVEVQGILDHGDDLWLATTRGMARYSPGMPLRLYNRYDGLMGEQFQPAAAMKAADGRFYFGSVRGFAAFYPHQVEVNAREPRVVLTALEIFNRPQAVGSSVLPKALHATEQIELSYRDNMFALVFSALSFSSPRKNRYRYMLEGFDKEWMDAGEQQRATYTNIPPGTYTFRVKAANNDGVWGAGEARLRIVVHPPFWWSLPAKILYVVLVLLLVYAYTQMRLRRAERRHAGELNILNEKKEAEAREARLRFFTMIAHEIRTPVSLIIAPLEQLMQQSHARDNGELGIIHRNAHRLLELVNQLLDFNKVQQQGVQVHFKLHHIKKLMEGVAVRFRPTFEQRGIRLEVDYPDADFCAVVDEEGVTKIISNLMTNAGKYTRDRVRLACVVDEEADRFRIVVEDNGEGISRKDREKIFRPFYQARDNKPGTGIGLSIVKNLVELHEGTVRVESEQGRGSVFVVELPISSLTPALPTAEVEPEAMELPPYVPAANNEQGRLGGAGGESRAAVLVVEDDEDMLGFISAHFRSRYKVLTAGNGLEALEQLHRHTVSLIVSDWMMPGMDGAELCRRVRSDRSISHVPFVMLTAKTDDDSKAEGMDCGADAYIEKPFSMKYLEACLRNLLAMRRQLMEHFAHTPTAPIANMATSEVDNDFLTQMNAIIEANIDNPSLNVAYLAERMGISRSGLFVKIKSLADATPNEMIQVIRLRRAAVLLRSGDYRVNEVSFMVGFGSPSYFAKCFQRQFGVKPAEYGGRHDRQ